MSVFVAAKKYLLPKLASEATDNLESAIIDIENECEQLGDATRVSEAIELLSEHKQHNDGFDEHIAEITRDNLGALFKIDRFRAWLETDGGKAALDLTTKAITWGAKALDMAAGEEPKEERILKCRNSCCGWRNQIQRRPASSSTCANCKRECGRKNDDLIVVVGKAEAEDET